MKAPLYISDSVIINPEFITIFAVRASGPGGQNVNKTSTKIQLLFDFQHCDALPDYAKSALLQRRSLRFDSEGKLLLSVQETRSQKTNIDIAYKKLHDIILRSLEIPKTRKKTAPSRSDREERLSTKKKHSQKKQDRAKHSIVSNDE